MPCELGYGLSVAEIMDVIFEKVFRSEECSVFPAEICISPETPARYRSPPDGHVPGETWQARIHVCQCKPLGVRIRAIPYYSHPECTVDQVRDLCIPQDAIPATSSKVRT
jgi:hypothetical protein